MQKHEGPRGPENDNEPPRRSSSWWLGLIIFALLGLIAGQLVPRWL